MKTTLLTLATTLAVATTVQAGNNTELQARRLFERAEVHFNVGEFAQALEVYKQAYKLHPLPGFIFNIGQCHRLLGDHEKAVFQFRTYLVRLPNAPNRGEVERLILESQALLDRQSATRPTTIQRSPELPPVLPPPHRPGRRRVHRAWFWSGAALSGALLVTGTVAGALNLAMSREYQDPATSVPRRIELKDKGEALGVASAVTLGTGGALAVATVVLYFYADFRARGTRSMSFVPTQGGVAIVLGGNF